MPGSVGAAGEEVLLLLPSPGHAIRHHPALLLLLLLHATPAAASFGQRDTNLDYIRSARERWSSGDEGPARITPLAPPQSRGSAACYRDARIRSLAPSLFFLDLSRCSLASLAGLLACVCVLLHSPTHLGQAGRQAPQLCRDPSLEQHTHHVERNAMQCSAPRPR